MKLYLSQKGSIGRDSSNQENIEYPNATDFHSVGIKQLFNATPGEETKIRIEHSDPVPFNLLSMTMRGVSYD